MCKVSNLSSLACPISKMEMIIFYLPEGALWLQQRGRERKGWGSDANLICPCHDRSLKWRKRIGMGEIGLVYFFNLLFSSLLAFLLARGSDGGLCLRTVFALLRPN